MSLSPTTAMRKLSLESTAQRTRSHSQMDASQSEAAGRSPERDVDVDEESVSGESMEEQPTIVRSPTGLRYDIGHLSDETQEVVRSLFGSTAEEPCEIALKWCGRLNDPEGNDDFYAFQMSEVVPRSVRIGSPQSKYSEPECRCGAKPCKHLIWLSDLIARQVLYNHDPDEPLTLNERGYAEELGSPFERIAEMRLDVLAAGLHCDVGYPASSLGPSSSRKAEAREILASMAEVDEYDLADYRRDLQDDDFDHSSLIHPSDLEATFFSLLLASHSLTAWVRSQLRPSDPPRDHFRLIHQRVLRIISALEAYSSASRDPSTGARHSSSGTEGPRDVAWAARSIERCVEEIRTTVARRQDRSPLATWERASAARALVRILRAVAERNVDMHAGRSQDDRNLYARLIGNRDTGFIHAALDLLVDQNQFVEELEDILELIGASGVSASWWTNMKRVVGRMRSWKGTGAGAGTDKRKGKAPVSMPPPDFTRSSSASASSRTATLAGQGEHREGQYLSAQTADSRRGRGERAGGVSGGAGSKRSGTGTGSGRDSKRAR